jgi:hypothetical protein
MHLTPELGELAENWKSYQLEAPITTDHKLVSVKLAHHEMPFIGKGRYEIPPHIIINRKSIQFVYITGHYHNFVTKARFA